MHPIAPNHPLLRCLLNVKDHKFAYHFNLEVNWFSFAFLTKFKYYSLISGRSDKQQGDVWPSDWLREKEIVMFSDIDQALIKLSPHSVETCDQLSLPCALTAFLDQIEVSWNDKRCFEQYTHRWWFVARKRRWALLKLGWGGSWGHTVPIQMRQVYYFMSVSALRGGRRGKESEKVRKGELTSLK